MTQNNQPITPIQDALAVLDSFIAKAFLTRQEHFTAIQITQRIGKQFEALEKEKLLFEQQIARLENENSSLTNALRQDNIKHGRSEPENENKVG